MKQFISLIIILGILLYNVGFTQTINAIGNLLSAIDEIVVWLFSLLLQHPSEFGIIDAINSRILLYLVIFVIGAFGITLTRRQRYRLFGIICDIVALISVALAFSS